MIPADREAMALRLRRQFAQMMRDDDPEETPGHQPGQLRQHRPFYMDDQMPTELAARSSRRADGEM